MIWLISVPFHPTQKICLFLDSPKLWIRLFLPSSVLNLPSFLRPHSSVLLKEISIEDALGAISWEGATPQNILRGAGELEAALMAIPFATQYYFL